MVGQSQRRRLNQTLCFRDQWVVTEIHLLLRNLVRADRLLHPGSKELREFEVEFIVDVH